MKKNKSMLFCAVMVLLFNLVAHADVRTAKGVPETEQLGLSAGVALACGVDRDQLKNYEMIASRLIVNPLKTDVAEKEALNAYAKAKLKAFKEQKQRNLIPCADVLKRFENQEIFKAVVYRDGTVKMPNGKVIKPERPVKKNSKKSKKK